MKGGGAEMAVGCNKISFVDQGYILEWNFLKVGMGAFFDII